MSDLIITSKKIVKYPTAHDFGDSPYYYFVWRPAIRQDSTVYYLGDKIILPTNTGYYYSCISPGISAATIPTYLNKINGLTEDGTAKFKAIPYDFKLGIGDTITTSTWKCTTSADVLLEASDVTLANAAIIDGMTEVKVTILNATLTEFVLTNIVSITRVDGKIEPFERSILVPITLL